MVDRNGQLVQSWSDVDKLFDVKCGRGPHKLRMSPYDPEKHVWVVDDQLHVIYKFAYDGKLVMTLGTKGQKGRDRGRLFDRPTDIAWLPNGTFFIGDGYGGTRVAKFDKDGTFLMEWGAKVVDPENPGPNEFNTVHAIAVGEDRRVYVADRGNGRIQVFDENGEFLDMWPIRRPLDVLMSADQHLWVADLDTSRILKYDLNGRYLYGWGSKGAWPGAFDCPARHVSRPREQSVRRRMFYWAYAEVPAEAERRPRKARGPGVAPGRHQLRSRCAGDTTDAVVGFRSYLGASQGGSQCLRGVEGRSASWTKR